MPALCQACSLPRPAPQVSEHASYSVRYYQRIIDAALGAAGAPADLVQIVTGYGDAGAALVTGGVDKVIFVGSTVVGKKVCEWGGRAGERGGPVQATPATTGTAMGAATQRRQSRRPAARAEARPPGGRGR
jgi:acyl-CoA reductase-like NAD-dependent aldehyde dehydrogenase